MELIISYGMGGILLAIAILGICESKFGEYLLTAVMMPFILLNILWCIVSGEDRREAEKAGIGQEWLEKSEKEAREIASRENQLTEERNSYDEMH